MECSPIKNTQASSTGTCSTMKAQAASAMMAISRFLTTRISVALSNLSASCPLVAENSTNGRMNSAPIATPASAGGSHATFSW